MADANHTPIRPPVDRATLILARYKAGQLVRLQYRAAGKKLTGVPSSKLREDDADAYLAAHRAEVMEWATKAVAEVKIKDPKPKR